MSMTTDVIDLLDALGDTAGKIAKTLAEKGIKGERGEPGCCPIYNYLTGEGIPVAKVGGRVIKLAPLGRVSPPAAVVEFIRLFDNAAWPELVAEVQP